MDDVDRAKAIYNRILVSDALSGAREFDQEPVYIRAMLEFVADTSERTKLLQEASQIVAKQFDGKLSDKADRLVRAAQADHG